MGNLVACSFAFKEGFNTSPQVNMSAGDATTQMYLKNIFVSLVSAKAHNEGDSFALCVNEPIDDYWVKRFNEEGIEVKVVPFDTFLISKDFTWALAYFKLCVMKALTDEGKYERYLLMDADTFTTRSYGDLWKECDFGVLMYPLGHTFSHPDRETVREDFVKLYPDEAKKREIVHYGGEFIAGNLASLKEYMKVCEQVFEKMREINFDVSKNAGDETIWSIAAALSFGKTEFVSACAYIFRFWTERFYLVSTVTVSNPVCIWHLPVEKRTGMLRVYNYYMKKKAFPSVEKASKIFGIVKAKRPVNFYTLTSLLEKVLRKLKIKK